MQAGIYNSNYIAEALDDADVTGVNAVDPEPKREQNADNEYDSYRR